MSTFRSKLTIVAAFLAAAPVAGVGYALVDVNANALRTLSREFQLAVADDLARTVEAELTSAEDGLDAVARALLSSDEHEVALAASLQLIAANGVIDHAGIYAADGTFIDAIRRPGSRDVQLPQVLDAHLRETADATGTAIGRARPGPGAGGVRLPIAIPLRVQDETSGYAFSLVSLASLQQRVEHLQRLRFQGADESLFVVDEGGRIVAHPKLNTESALVSAIDHPALDGLLPAIKTGHVQQTREYTSADGGEWLGTVVALKGRGLAVVVQVPQEVAYATLAVMRRLIAAVVVATILTAVLLSIWFATRVTQPLKTLTEFAGKLSARRFGERVKVRTNDELEVLGDAMSEAAASLEASEERVRAEVAIRNDLGRYLPNELVDQVVARKQNMHLGGVRQDITIMFADVVAFTPIARELPPETVVALLNELFTITTGLVFRHGGMIDKFIGDCVMAIWGAPKPMDDHASRALMAARDIMSWLETANERWEARYGVTLQLAIGIHSGSAVVGNIGSETRMEYTAIGDAVNLASQLESIARPQQVLLSGETARLAGEGFDLVDLGARALSGRRQSVHLFALQG